MLLPLAFSEGTGLPRCRIWTSLATALPDGGRDWSAAPPYVRQHLATHAAAAGLLSDLIADPGFLLACEPLGLLRALASVDGDAPRRIRTAYEQVAHRLTPDRPLGDRAADLQLSARRCEADELAERIDRLGVSLPWTARWAWWSASGTHRLLSGHADRVDCGDRSGLLSLWDLAEQRQIGQPVAAHQYFGPGGSDRLLISDARQVRRYFTEPDVRAAVRARLLDVLTERTEVVIAHSLGSVVAYETLCAHPELPDLTLITLGSPLAVHGLVLDRLDPPPYTDRARWPACVTRWTNIADRGDAVALNKELAPVFGPRVTDRLVHNGAKAHDVRPYLTARETGEAVATALRR